MFTVSMPRRISLSELWWQDRRNFFVHFPFGCGINFEDIGVPGLHSAVENDRRLQAHMKSMQGLFPAMDIGCRFKPGEKGPEKFLQGTGCRTGRINQQDHGPGGNAGELGERGGQIG